MADLNSQAALSAIGQFAVGGQTAPALDPDAVTVEDLGNGTSRIVVSTLSPKATAYLQEAAQYSGGQLTFEQLRGGVEMTIPTARIEVAAGAANVDPGVDGIKGGAFQNGVPDLGATITNLPQEPTFNGIPTSQMPVVGSLTEPQPSAALAAVPINATELSNMTPAQQEDAFNALINGGTAKIYVTGIGAIETSEGKLSIDDVKGNKDLMAAIAADIKAKNPELAKKFEQLAEDAPDVDVQDRLNALSGRLTERGRANAGIEAALNKKNLEPEAVVNQMLQNAGIDGTVKDAQLLGEGGAYDGKIKLELKGLSPQQAQAFADKYNDEMRGEFVTVLNEGMGNVIKINAKVLAGEVAAMEAAPKPEQAVGDPAVTKTVIGIEGFEGKTYQAAVGKPIDSIDFSMSQENFKAIEATGGEMLNDPKASIIAKADFNRDGKSDADFDRDGTVSAPEAGVLAVAMGATTITIQKDGTTVKLSSEVTKANLEGFMANPDARNQVLEIARAIAKDNGIKVAYSGEVPTGMQVASQAVGGKAQTQSNEVT